jgi:hypothetical protein
VLCLLTTKKQTLKTAATFLPQIQLGRRDVNSRVGGATSPLLRTTELDPDLALFSRSGASFSSVRRRFVSPAPVARFSFSLFRVRAVALPPLVCFFTSFCFLRCRLCCSPAIGSCSSPEHRFSLGDVRWLFAGLVLGSGWL